MSTSNQYQAVTVQKYPISDRYCSVGAEAQLDTKNSKIRVGGAWFDFDDRWEVTPIEQK